MLIDTDMSRYTLEAACYGGVGEAGRQHMLHHPFNMVQLLRNDLRSKKNPTRTDRENRSRRLSTFLPVLTSAWWSVADCRTKRRTIRSRGGLSGLLE